MAFRRKREVGSAPPLADWIVASQQIREYEADPELQRYRDWSRGRLFPVIDKVLWDVHNNVPSQSEQGISVEEAPQYTEVRRADIVQGSFAYVVTCDRRLPQDLADYYCPAGYKVVDRPEYLGDDVAYPAEFFNCISLEI